jgi:hypothetical protein
VAESTKHTDFNVALPRIADNVTQR